MEHHIEIRQMFDESFKRMVIEEYLSTRCSKISLLKKYNIHFKSAIQTWMKKLGYVDNIDTKSNFARTNKFQLKKSKSSEPVSDSFTHDELKKRIKELEHHLEDEKLLREMYEKMINAAEDQYKISIRKKTNTR